MLKDESLLHLDGLFSFLSWTQDENVMHILSAFTIAIAMVKAQLYSCGWFKTCLELNAYIGNKVLNIT